MPGDQESCRKQEVTGLSPTVLSMYFLSQALEKTLTIQCIVRKGEIPNQINICTMQILFLEIAVHGTFCCSLEVVMKSVLESIRSQFREPPYEVCVFFHYLLGLL